MNNSGDKVFKMLAFQYKPLEKSMFAFWKETDMYDEFYPKYKKFDSMKKIKILDMHASYCGL